MIWRYLKTQASVLMYGMIGPFFLILYVASDRDEFMRWFLWSGLVITVICVVTAVAITVNDIRSTSKMAELERIGVVALAQVTQIDDTGTEVRGQTLATLTLAISGPGISPFTARDRVIVSLSRLPMITGRKLVVLVDPATNEFRIDWDRSALISGLTPAIFTFADEDQTYDLSGEVEPLMEILRILKSHGLGLKDTVDWASYPAARQQIREIVRRASAQPGAPPQPAARSAGVERTHIPGADA